eukprot:m.194756 g.194756  ORF g.194756 m.194756 type:complete len:663 (+) comp32541_c2_seq5:255-2243(+)
MTRSMSVAGIIMNLVMYTSSSSGSGVRQSDAFISLTGEWTAEGHTIQMSQHGTNVTTSAEWGSGVGTLDDMTLSIKFSNSQEKYSAVVVHEFTCLRFDNGHFWARVNFTATCVSPSPPLPPVAVGVPAWTENAIIYEICPKVFTSPNGTGENNSGSGTLFSAAKMLPQLADVGVNVVWLAGWALSNNHFRGIWSTYAAVDLNQIDPTLGGGTALRTFVSEAHAHGIKVVLDVTTHGVVPVSPVIEQHRNYFEGNGTSGTWRMIDYNYSDPGFQHYWPQIFIDVVSKYNVDGFRLDCGMSGKCGAALVARQLWDHVAVSANASGHPVLIMPECGEPYHFTQKDTPPTTNMAASVAELMVNGSVTRQLCRATVQISCHDYGKTTNVSGNYFAVRGSRALLGYNLLGPMIVVMMSGEEFDTDQVELTDVSEGHYGMNTSCEANDPPGTDLCYGRSFWLYGARIQWDNLRQEQIAMRGDTKKLLAVRATHADVLHSNLCTTHIVSVNVIPTPTTSMATAADVDVDAGMGGDDGNDIGGGGDVGGVGDGGGSGGGVKAVRSKGVDFSVYQPYARYTSGVKAVIVVANPNTLTSSTLSLDVGPDTLNTFGFANSTGPASCFSVTDLYQGGAPRIVSRASLSVLVVTVAPDHSERGGLAVLLLTPTQCL